MLPGHRFQKTDALLLNEICSFLKNHRLDVSNKGIIVSFELPDPLSKLLVHFISHIDDLSASILFIT